MFQTIRKWVRQWALAETEYLGRFYSEGEQADVPPTPRLFRRFWLKRFDDLHGKSGTGYKVLGIMWPNGKINIQWQTSVASGGDFDTIEDLMKIHGHEGATVIVWIDKEPDEDDSNVQAS